MEHFKKQHSEVIDGASGQIVVQGPLSPDQLKQMTLHAQLDAFRRPQEQHEALVEIAELPEGRIIAAFEGQVIVGYVTFHYPDEYELWAEGNMEDLVELGAIEVANDYRGKGISKKLLELSFRGGQLDHVIVFTTEYYWHWDLEHTGLNVWDYRKMMEKLMKNVDMVWFATDDPEICSHPANCLMVRVGRNVPQSSVEAFDRLRFRQRFMY
ncbi:GNAT family N-acetyltransferase [Saccharibacillus sp. JS10]|uniref:GNAT family N-acetyltransferase n=1 Tax=Saccharibacillus sp. JS10 TaxID=2950552 RepID=UPI002109A7CE|nr:GNAT family N-acetyltransferase [Saccharibacillus sp. JS10]MCQ4085698.1 GNAT family N-acetyltransferase [Saccharibacillus sp. JS10]